MDDDDNNNDGEDDEDEPATAAVGDPILSSFTSQSPFSGQITSPSEMIRQESDTSTDELALDIQLSMRGKHRHAGQSKKHSSSQRGSKVNYEAASQCVGLEG